jgi:deoxycytidylate deaminase
VGATLLNQNRIIAGVGYNIDTHNQLQLSYIHQKIWNFPDTIEENNPTVRLSYYTNFSFVKK